MKHYPIAIGLVLCEQIIVEEGTKNVTPVNCFSVRELTGSSECFVISRACLVGGWAGRDGGRIDC